MSGNLIDEKDGYGFVLTRFCGPPERRRMYQINESGRWVQLDDWQMLQLLAAFLKDSNAQARLSLAALLNRRKP